MEILRFLACYVKDRPVSIQRIERVLNQCDGDKTSAAELLGMHLATLYRRIERLGLSEGEDPTG